MSKTVTAACLLVISLASVVAHAGLEEEYQEKVRSGIMRRAEEFTQAGIEGALKIADISNLKIIDQVLSKDGVNLIVKTNDGKICQIYLMRGDSLEAYLEDKPGWRESFRPRCE